jgi:hypothetical protein
MKLADLSRPKTSVFIKNLNIIHPGPEKEAIINPGIEYGEDDKAKWFFGAARIK